MPFGRISIKRETITAKISSIASHEGDPSNSTEVTHPSQEYNIDVKALAGLKGTEASQR